MKPVVLCILDGVGIRKQKHGNAVKLANMPTFNKLLKEYPSSLLEACGESVGLPKGQMGNSEVGHTNIGAGRIVYQPLEIINRSIRDNTFFETEKLKKFISSNKKLHILGLLSDGGIHSHINHLLALIDMAKKCDIEELYIHVFTDGRDTLPDCSLKYIEQLEQKLQEVGIGKIASISGRYYAMDRDNNYDRIKLCYDVLTTNQKEVKDYENYIKENYEKKIFDEFIEPIKITNEGTIQDGDNIITFNFRPDRLRELFSSLTNPKFKGFETKITTKLLTMFTVSDEVIYDHLFDHINLDNSFGTYIDSLGMKQLRIAETEKYAHVTYFFDGGKELDLKGSKRILIHSPKVKTYDLKPEMSATEITDTLLKELDKDIYDVVILNYANGDMVGHTGSLEATIKALETLDNCLEKLLNKVKEKDGILVVTADHGNSDYMLDKENRVITSHSMSKVPFIVCNKKYCLKNGKLSDIAPTLLYLLGKEKPKEMTGKNLIKSKWPKQIFKILSFLLFFAMMIFYINRFVHYYKIEHPDVAPIPTLSEKIKENSEERLKNIDSDYVFYGNVEDNYVSYSNQLWRIVKVNDDNTITLVNDDIVSTLAYSYETNEFKNSYVYEWLQNNYLPVLNNSDKYLVNDEFCVNGGKIKKENCSETLSSKIGLLAYYNYVDAGANNSYLNIGKYFWTLTPSENNKTWYVFQEGGVNDKSYEGSTYYSYGIRPVIKLKENINYMGGNGTKDSPYTFEEKEQLGIGSYIKYGDYTFRIIKKDDTSIYLALSELLDVSHIFSNNSSTYKKNDYNSLYNYLNNIFYNQLDKTLLIDGTWYNGSYNIETNYNYQSIYKNSIIAKVGLMNISDLFTTDLVDYYTMTPYNSEMVISIQENGMIYSSEINEKKKIRPVICITNSIQEISGTGSISDPYVVGGA